VDAIERTRGSLTSCKQRRRRQEERVLEGGDDDAMYKEGLVVCGGIQGIFRVSATAMMLETLRAVYPRVAGLSVVVGSC